MAKDLGATIRGTDESEKAPEEIEFESLPGNFPYAVLTVVNKSDEHIEKIARQFGLEITALNTRRDTSRFRILCKDPQEGEHKLQTLTLMTIAALISELTPEARFCLSIESNFRDALTGKIETRELTIPDQAGLWADEASQLFLSQAGFAIASGARGGFHGVRELRDFAISLINRASASKQRIGA